MAEIKKFLKRVLESGFDTGNLDADDILRHVTADILANHLPVAVKARLLKASLDSASMTPQLVVDTVGFDNLAEHIPPHVVWGCIQAAVDRPPTAARHEASTQADQSPIAGTPPPAAASATDATGVRNGSRRRTRPPPPPGSRDMVVQTSTPQAVAATAAPAAAQRKPNIAANPEPVPASRSSRAHSRAGTLDRALDALEMDDSVYDEQTKAGQPAPPRPEGFSGPDRTDVFPADRLREPDAARSDFDEDTNPGIRRDPY